MSASTRSKTGFTLIELIIVVIILGILASIGLIQFLKTIERGRSAEARKILGSIRAAQGTYRLENSAYTTDTALLTITFPTSCTSTHYFSYSLAADSATAIRCSSGGKTPDALSAYTITLSYSEGVWSGSAGYY
jgi:prepilin-type N-terminal cleavage/methylation domain-containing protein